MNQNTTMLQLFQKFDDTTDTMNKLKFVLEALKRTPNLESVTYTANNDNIIVGEVYYIKSSGEYVFKSEGSGKSSYMIKEPANLTVLHEGDLDDTTESEAMLLTAGDIVYFHASADPDMTQSITLQQTSTLFEVMSSKLDEHNEQFKYLDSRINNLLNVKCHCSKLICWISVNAFVSDSVCY